MPNIHLAEPSIRSLFLQMQFSGQRLSTGTGFVVHTTKGPCLITNWHNVTGRRSDDKQLMSPTGAVPDEIVIAHNRAGRLGQWVHRTERLYVNGCARWIEHPTFGDKVDFVALPLVELADVQTYPYTFDSPPIFCGPADGVSVIGFPFGMTAGGLLGIWATGFIASEPDVDFRGLPIFLVDCRTRPGQSGSAVIAYRSGGMVGLEDGNSAVFTGPIWKFLGIYSGRINQDSDLGLVWKAKAIEDLVKSV